MPICIECRFPVTQLYTTYSKADDRALGKGVRLTQCPRCKRFADKYVEHDFVVLFIDLVLIKPQVYRHLLFNRLGREDDRLQPSILRFGILLLLFDVYLTWARVEKAYPQGHDPSNTLGPSAANATISQRLSSQPPDNLLTTQPILLQYLFFLFLCGACVLSFHAPIRLLATVRLPRPLPNLLVNPYPYANRISTALLVSSCTKLFPILMVIWDYDLPSAATAVAWAVIVNNVAALEILLDCGFARAAALVVIGASCRALVGSAILKAVGLEVGRTVWGGEAGAGPGLGNFVGLFGFV